jgi:hypothetical protein
LRVSRARAGLYTAAETMSGIHRESVIWIPRVTDVDL